MASKPISTNVVRLPTAARRIVVNPSRAARTYRSTQPEWPSRRKAPWERQDDRPRQSPEFIIVLAMLSALDPERREIVEEYVAQRLDRSGEVEAAAAAMMLSRAERGLR